MATVEDVPAEVNTRPTGTRWSRATTSGLSVAAMLVVLAVWRLMFAMQVDVAVSDPRMGAAEREHRWLLVLQAASLAGMGASWWCWCVSRYAWNPPGRREARIALGCLVGLAAVVLLIQTKDGLTEWGPYES